MGSSIPTLLYTLDSVIPKYYIPLKGTISCSLSFSPIPLVHI